MADAELTDTERRDMHIALSDSYDDLDEFVSTLIAGRVVAARAQALDDAADAVGKRYTTAAWLRLRAREEASRG